MSANAEIIAELRRVLNERDEARERNTDLRTMLEQVTRERDSYQRQLDAIGDAIVPALVQRIEPRLSRHPVTVIMAAGALIAKIGEAIGCEFTDGDDLLEAVKELVRERDEARANYQWMVDRACDEKLDGYRELAAKCAQLEEERDEARAEVERLRGILPELPPRAPDGHGLPRYGLRWNGPSDPASVPMADGYWTPWHLASDAYRRGAEAMRKRCAMWVKHNSHEDGLGMGSQRMESALAALPIPEEP